MRKNCAEKQERKFFKKIILIKFEARFLLSSSLLILNKQKSTIIFMWKTRDNVRSCILSCAFYVGVANEKWENVNGVRDDSRQHSDEMRETRKIFDGKPERECCFVVALNRVLVCSFLHSIFVMCHLYLLSSLFLYFFCILSIMLCCVIAISTLCDSTYHSICICAIILSELLFVLIYLLSFFVISSFLLRIS